MSLNKFDVEITEELSTNVYQLVEQLEGLLGFAAGLPWAERKRMAKMGRKNVDFVQRAFMHAGTSPDYLPAGTGLTDFSRDLNGGKWLRGLLKRLKSMVKKIDDTAMLAEVESFNTSRMYYSCTKMAARAGDANAERIAKDLAVHYRRKKNGEDTGNTGDNSEPEA